MFEVTLSQWGCKGNLAKGHCSGSSAVWGRLNTHCWALVAALPEPGQATSYWLFHDHQDICAEFYYIASKLFACQWDINGSWAPKAPRVQGSAPTCSPVQNQPHLESLGWLRVVTPGDWELNFAPTDWVLMDELKKAWLSYIKEVSGIWKITLLGSLIFWYFYEYK